MNDEASVTIEISDGAKESADTVATALRVRAAGAGSRAALADSFDRAGRGLGQPRSITYREADAIADRIAEQFGDAGLGDGDFIAIQAPNTVEAPLLIIGAWRAGLVPCLLPMMWQFNEIDRAFSQVRPAAAVAVGRYGEDRPAETMSDAAAVHLSVRFVFAYGETLPDGVTIIDDWFAAPDSAGRQPPRPEGREAQPDRTALVTWAIARHGACPVVRSHRQIATLARMFNGALHFSNRDVLLNPYPYTGIAALAGQLAAPLMSGAGIVLHLPFDFAVFQQQLERHDVSCAVVPAPVISALEERRDLRTGKLVLNRLGCVWPSPHGIRPGTGLFEPSLSITDIHTFAELAVLVRERAPGTDPSLLPLAKIDAPEGDAGGKPALEMRVRGSVANEASQQVLKGTLMVRGSTVPRGAHAPDGAPADPAATALEPDAHGYIDTGIGCIVDDTTASRFRCKKSEDLIYHGGAVVAASELDRLYGEFSEFLDAAVFVLDDTVIGERIFAAVVPRPELPPSLRRFKEFLAEKRVAPYKTPDQLVIVRSIPRSGDGAVLRDRILSHI